MSTVKFVINMKYYGFIDNIILCTRKITTKPGNKCLIKQYHEYMRKRSVLICEYSEDVHIC